MVQHADELIIWNRKMNLTAIKDPLAIAEKHFIDSAAASLFLGNEKTLLDMGTGAGFPGIPLKILRPDLKVLLLDASRKKVSFLNHVIRMLALKDIKALHARAEDLHNNPEYKLRYDGMISRAFTKLSDFVDLAIPFLSPEGALFAMKGKNVQKEIHFTKAHNFNIQMRKYMLPFTQAERFIVKLSPKINDTFL